MSTENDDLFEGLQIMSPSELNNSLKGEQSGDEGNASPNFQLDSVESEFTLEPVKPTETGDSGVDNKTTASAEVKTETKTSSSNENQSEVVYKALMKELVTAGVLTVEEMEKLDEMPGTFDSIKDLVQKTVETHTKEREENWKKGLSPEKKRFLEIEDAFDDTQNAIIMAQRLEFFDNTTDESIKGNQQLQKQIYFEQLKSKNFSDSEALEAVEDAIAINKLEEKALKAVPELRSQAEKIVADSKAAKEQKTAAEIEEQTKAFETLLTTIDSTESFIDGLNLNKVSRDKLKNNIVEPVYKDPKTGKEFNSLMFKQHKNPTQFELLVNYYDSIGLFNLDKEGKFKPDISKLKAVAKTAAINELDKVIAAEEQRGVGRNTSVETSQKTEGILNMLERAIGNK